MNGEITDFYYFCAPQQKNLFMPLSDTEVLQKYLPVAAVEPIRQALGRYHVNFTITRDRRSKNGDFKPGLNGQRHSISVNGSLNKYEFLMIVLHELAHLIVFEKFGNRRVPSHGKEWKQQYGTLLREAADKGFFHPSINQLIHKYSYSVKASGIADLELAMALRAFDKHNSQHSIKLLEELPEGCTFIVKNGMTLIKGAKVRKRYTCACIKTGKRYLVNPMLKVTHHNNHEENNSG